VFVPLIALTIFYGVWPGPVLDASAASVANLLQTHTALLDALKVATLGQ
jgi:NADH-quinone oxidoreductase subunit M